MHFSDKRRDVTVAGDSLRAPGRQFWVLAVFLCVVFLLGGSSQPDVPMLVVLRPVAILVAAYALFTLTSLQWRQYRYLAFLAGAVVLLVVAHLVPLPPSLWHGLPGRDILRDIDAITGIQDEWRPLSMVPQGALNALYSLSVPIAVLALAAQQNRTGHLRLVMLLIVLITLSGIIGLLQASGTGIRLYSSSSDLAGLFSNRNHQGVVLGIAFPLLAVAAFLRQRGGFGGRWVKIAAAAIGVVLIPLILVTGSRAALGAAAVGIMAFPLLRLRLRAGGDRGGSRKLMMIGWVAAIVLVIAIALFVVLAARESAIGRIDATAVDPRYPVWGSIVARLPDYMPWGAGIGAYSAVYQIFEPAELLRPTFSNHAHNDYLEVLFTAGVPGLVILLWAIALFVIAAWKSVSVSDAQAPFCRLGLVIIAILALASAVDYPVRTPIMSAVLALAAIWAASMRRFGNEV
jgi:O-antigen ligase